MADVIVPISGWGYSTWGTDGWSDSPAIPFATGAVGSITVTANATVSLTGVSGTTSLGTSEAQIRQSVLVTGLSATGEIGYTRWDMTVDLGGWGRGVWGQGPWGESLGVSATGAIGSVSVQEGAGVYLTGVQAAVSLGNIAVNADGGINALGNAATGEIGTATVVGDAIFSVTAVSVVSPSAVVA